MIKMHLHFTKYFGSSIMFLLLSDSYCEKEGDRGQTKKNMKQVDHNVIPQMFSSTVKNNN